jgi:low temperature requirement protein LtrA
MDSLLRTDNGRVGFAELFFDLVFVFAITQVSHLLLHHFSPLGAVEATLIFLAVWWVWIYTTWVLNWLDPDKAAVRMLLFALMAAGLYLSMAIPDAFSERGLIFALAYTSMQIGRTAFMLWTVRKTPVRRQTYVRILLYFCVGAVAWIGGALADPHLRLPIWALALLIDYSGPVLSYYVPGLGTDKTTNWRVSGSHIAERCGLFVIICLGETLLISGATFAEMAWTVTAQAAFLASVAVTIAMWWVYFHIGHKRGAHQIETSDDPGRIARLSFTYAHIPIIAGIVLAAVGAERAIAHPGAVGGAGDMSAIGGGLVLFLAGNGWFKWLSAPWFPLSHLVGLGLVGALMVVGLVLPLWATGVLAAAILVLVAAWEQVSLSRAAAV